MIPARWFPPGSALLLISRGQAARPLSAQAQHPLASAPAGTHHDASEATQALRSPGGGAAQL